MSNSISPSNLVTTFVTPASSNTLTFDLRDIGVVVKPDSVSVTSGSGGFPHSFTTATVDNGWEVTITFDDSYSLAAGTYTNITIALTYNGVINAS